MDARFTTNDLEAITAIQAGDDTIFAALVECYSASMKRVAMLFVPNTQLADEVLQETWIAVLRGVDRFEGRSSLKTWLFSILTNRARTYAQREGQYIPFDFHIHDSDEAVDSEMLNQKKRWNTLPSNWKHMPEATLLSGEVQSLIWNTINQLGNAQRQVITLRDIEGWSSEETCAALGITETNQRVLLHRARVRVRQVLNAYFVEI